MLIKFSKMEYVESLFVDACYKGDMLAAQDLLIDYPDIDVFVENGKALQYVCEHNHQIAEWLLSFNPKKDIVDYVFVELCYYGNFESAKWLFSKIPTIDVTTRGHCSFKWACEFARLTEINDYTTIVNWFVSLKPYHYHVVLNNNHVIDYYVRPLRDVKWLERKIPMLAYNSDSYNIFQELNMELIREICLYV